jgi:hypothetical protein
MQYYAGQEVKSSNRHVDLIDFVRINKRGDDRVLDKPSMISLKVWSELLSWRPWFGQLIMMVKARVVKPGRKWFQLEAPE